MRVCAQHLKRERTTEEKSEGETASVHEGPASFGKKEDCFTREETYSTERFGFVGALLAPLAKSFLAPLVISLLQS